MDEERLLGWNYAVERQVRKITRTWHKFFPKKPYVHVPGPPSGPCPLGESEFRVILRDVFDRTFSRDEDVSSQGFFF